MKEGAFMGSEEKLLIGEIGGETRHQDREVQAELQHAVNLGCAAEFTLQSFARRHVTLLSQITISLQVFSDSIL
jgi:hypothetical protein